MQKAVTTAFTGLIYLTLGKANHMESGHMMPGHMRFFARFARKIALYLAAMCAMIANNHQPNKKAALGPNRSSIAGRLPILFDPALAGFLSKVNALGRAPAC